MELKMIEYFSEHWYKIEYENEKKEKVVDYLPSTTTKLSAIAKPGLAKWKGDIGNREAFNVMFEAQQKGKRIHHAWELYAGGYTICYIPWYEDYTPEENHFYFRSQEEYLDFLKLHEWYKIVQPNILFSEKTVYSIEQNEAGTIDNVMFIKGGKYKINGSKELELIEGNYIVDLKSGKNVYDDSYMQVADYMMMAVNNKIVDSVVGALILHTNAATRAGIVGMATKLRTIEELRDDYQDFRAVAKMWARNNKNAKPKVLEFPNKVNKETCKLDAKADKVKENAKNGMPKVQK